METSQLIFKAKHLAGFHMMAILGFNELILEAKLDDDL